MRFDAAVAAALLAACARADAVDSASSAASAVSSAVESATASLGEKPTFTPVDIKAPFFEQFTDDWETRWKVSKAKKDDPKSDEDWAYVGEWSVEEPHELHAINGDKGLVVKNVAAHHAISAKFPKKIDNKGKTLVVQYEVQLQNDLQCGGAYMKLLQDNKALHQEEFGNTSPYIIMFGPDKCGTTNKVHFIFRHKNPKTKEYEEKHLKSAPLMRTGKSSHTYTLIVKPDQTFEILVDGKDAKSGSLLEDFDPPVNPEKEIEDPEDKKPESWVDTARIPDPEATKPEDWDEDAPFEIVDADAEKPEDWLDDEPTMIPDPEAQKPEDWDDEEDGDWQAPMVSNPKCEEASGCGKWTPPQMKNPAYKGKWTAPYIDNPEYKGVWKPRQIKNPNYFEDKTPANFEPMGAIGFEIWTMQNDILFDNIYIGHSIEDAETIRAKTIDIKKPIQDAELETQAPPEPKKAASPTDLVFADDPVLYITERTKLFITLVQKDPVEAARFLPDIAAGLAVGLLTILGALIGLIGLGASSPAVQDKAKVAADKTVKAAKDAKDQAASAASSGAEKVQAEVNKRTTRSSKE